MKILVVSDTHGQEWNLETVLEKTGKIDMMIHCGDAEGHEDYICALADCPVHIVRGNSDFYNELEFEEEFTLGKYRAFLTHGHRYNVSLGNDRIKEEAIARGADIVFFGHSHKPVVDLGGVMAINPGSLTYPRQDDRRSSYILMEIDQRQEVHFTINYL